MKSAVFISLLLFIAFGVHAQTLKGNVVDGETLKPLYPAIVVNGATGQSTSTDEHGFYSLPANAGDLISFSFSGYHTIQRDAASSLNMNVDLLPLTVRMQEYILKDYTLFQKDSIQMATLYSTELNKKSIGPGFSSANGGGFTGLIGGPVQKLSKSYKQNKKFKKNFQHDMEQKFIDTRYTPALVSTLTGFTGDTLVIFMNIYPMEYAFARAASDLEIKMWVRNNYREYKNQPAQSGGSYVPGVDGDSAKQRK